MALTYCLKCRQKTDTNEVEYYTNSNGVKRISGKCAICNTRKSQFLKS